MSTAKKERRQERSVVGCQFMYNFDSVQRGMERTKDLRGFLTEYERENPKEFCRIKREVDPEYEVAGILTKLEELRKLPILFYERVKGSSFSRGDQCLFDKKEDCSKHWC